jgi:hypothetical protein
MHEFARRKRPEGEVGKERGEPAPPQHELLALQRAAGNQAVARALRGGGGRAPRSVQRFVAPDGFQFITGHTTAPASLTYAQIGGTMKRHHIVPDSSILVLLNSLNREQRKQYKQAALNALDSEMERLRQGHRHMVAWAKLDDWLYDFGGQVPPKDFPLGEVPAMIAAYAGEELPPPIAELEHWRNLVADYNAAYSYPAAFARFDRIVDFATFFELNVPEPKPAGPQLQPPERESRRQRRERLEAENRDPFKEAIAELTREQLNSAILAKLTKLVDELGEHDYKSLKTDKTIVGRIPASIAQLQNLRNKVDNEQELTASELNDQLAPVLTWMPGNIMIGPADRKWEPGDDVDFEVLLKHSDSRAAGLVARLADALNLIPPGLSQEATNALAVLRAIHPEGPAELLAQLALQRPTKESPLEAGPDSTDQTAQRAMISGAIESTGARATNVFLDDLIRKLQAVPSRV